MARELVCGTAAEPDYYDPADPATPLTLADFGIPRRKRYNPTLLERFLADGDEATLTSRTWQRLFERGELRGTKIGGTWWTTYEELLAYFLRNSNVISLN